MMSFSDICAAQASAAKMRLLWLVDMNALVYSRGRRIGKLHCCRPYFPISSTGAHEVHNLREAILDQIWQEHPEERA